MPDRDPTICHLFIVGKFMIPHSFFSKKCQTLLKFISAHSPFFLCILKIRGKYLSVHEEYVEVRVVCGTQNRLRICVVWKMEDSLRNYQRWQLHCSNYYAATTSLAISAKYYSMCRVLYSRNLSVPCLWKKVKNIFTQLVLYLRASAGCLLKPIIYKWWPPHYRVQWLSLIILLHVILVLALKS
jgi:hypothetical protein